MRRVRASVQDRRSVRTREVQEVLGVLAEAGFVHLTADGEGGGAWYWTSESYPADAVSLRSVSSDNFVIVDTTNGADVIGETDFTSGLPTLHPKAIYLMEGKLFQVERLDFEGRKAYVRGIDCDYYNDAITYTRVKILDEFESAAFEPTVRCMSSLASSASRRSSSHDENVGSGELDLPDSRCTRRRTG